jgi:large subunit ribosomal protein L20
MPRSKNKVASRARRRKMLKHAKGYWGARSKVWTIAKHHIEKGWQYAYRDRKAKKRVFRSLWITRINAAARLNGTTYSRLMHGIAAHEMKIDRKMLADLAMHEPATFTSIVETVRGQSSLQE